MSSILDALERASQERQPGKEDILPSAKVLPPDTRDWRPGLLIVLFMLLVVVIGYWFISNQKPPQPEVPVTLTAEEDMKSSPVELQKKIISKSGLPAKQPIAEKAETIADRIRRSALPNQRPLVSEAVLSPVIDERKVEQLKPKQVQTNPILEQSPARITKEAVAIQKLETLVVTKLPQADDEKVPAKQVVREIVQPKQVRSEVKPVQPIRDELSEIKDPESQIPLIWELPQGLREELSELKTTIHVYNKKPELRFVIVNMHRYGEGDVLTPKGYRLKRIDRDGIVVDYGGGLVRLLREKY